MAIDKTLNYRWTTAEHRIWWKKEKSLRLPIICIVMIIIIVSAINWSDNKTINTTLPDPHPMSEPR